jgi:transposase
MSGVNKRPRQAKHAGVVGGEGNKQRRFTDEFKREAVRLTMTSGRSVERVADDLGIAKSTLSRWRSEHGRVDLLEGPHEDAAKELARLRKENEILRQEREILKKAAAFFAKEGSR